MLLLSLALFNLCFFFLLPSVIHSFIHSISCLPSGLSFFTLLSLVNFEFILTTLPCSFVVLTQYSRRHRQFPSGSSGFWGQSTNIYPLSCQLIASTYLELAKSPIIYLCCGTREFQSIRDNRCAKDQHIAHLLHHTPLTESGL